MHDIGYTQLVAEEDLDCDIFTESEADDDWELSAAEKEARDLEKDLRKILKDTWVEDIYVDTSMRNTSTGPIIAYIEIDGDWKHDHLRATNAIEEFAKERGYDIISRDEEITRDDGSDDYGARYTFAFLPMEQKESMNESNSSNSDDSYIPVCDPEDDYDNSFWEEQYRKANRDK